MTSEVKLGSPRRGASCPATVVDEGPQELPFSNPRAPLAVGIDHADAVAGLMEHESDRLPLIDNGTHEDNASRSPKPKRALKRSVTVAGLLFVGSVLGLYFQGPALRGFYRITGLEPGGGARHPIVKPIETPEEQVANEAPRGVVALGRLRPRTGTITVHAPYGAADARVATLDVEEGQAVESGDVIATLDNGESLQSVVSTAKANVAVRTAALRQTRELVSSTQSELKATHRRAKAASKHAAAELTRSQQLFDKGVIGQTELDTLETAAAESVAEVQRISAALRRYRADPKAGQADVALAETNLAAAQTELDRSVRDLRRSRVVAPQDGTVLEINARPGEAPGLVGVVELGDLTRMTAELEVYQTDIGRIGENQVVRLSAEPLGPDPLLAEVTHIGLKVGRQTLTRDDPAANTDARVVTVLVTLDEPSTLRAQRLTGLEVIATFEEATP